MCGLKWFFYYYQKIARNVRIVSQIVRIFRILAGKYYFFFRFWRLKKSSFLHENCEENFLKRSLVKIKFSLLSSFQIIWGWFLFQLSIKIHSYIETMFQKCSFENIFQNVWCPTKKNLVGVFGTEGKFSFNF